MQTVAQEQKEQQMQSPEMGTVLDVLVLLVVCLFLRGSRLILLESSVR